MLAIADSTSVTAYREAVQEAYDLIRESKPSATEPGARAAALLRSATGTTQPEILADLTSRPPDYDDARARLLALLTALDQPAKTADPELSGQRLREVLSEKRFDALHQPPSPLERAAQWVKDRIRDFLRVLFGPGSGSRIPSLYLYILAAAILVAAAVIIFRSTRGRLIETMRASAAPGPRPPADYFAEADQLASQGDRVGAIRRLCAGVAASIAGERTWEGSPLTVREIFRHAPDHDTLRPLLLPFEAAVYGGRDVDQATYEKAVQAAARYRQPVEAAA